MINSFKLTAITLSIILFSCSPTEKEIVIETWENGNVAILATYLMDKSTEKMIQKDIYTSDGQHFMSIDVINNDTLRYYELHQLFEGAEFQGIWKGEEEDAGFRELNIDRSSVEMSTHFKEPIGELKWFYKMTQEDNTIFIVWVEWRIYYTNGDYESFVIDDENLTNEGQLLQISLSPYITHDTPKIVDTLGIEDIKAKIFIRDDTLNLFANDSVALKFTK